MGRRSAEATKARRTRRTRGEIGLRLFLLLVEAVVFFFDDVDGLPLAGALFVDVRPEEAEVDDWDWAIAGGNKPSQGRRKIPTNTATAKRRTQAYLVPEVGTHDRKIVFCETSYYFMLKVIAGSSNRAAVTLLVR
jgi:hypothetical protein